LRDIGPLSEFLRIDQRSDLVIGDDLVIAFEQYGKTVLNRDGRTALDGRRSVDALVLQGRNMIGKRQVDGLNIGIMQTGRFQQRIQCRRVADAWRIHCEFHAL
jgi:hypothetical protein